MDQEAPPLILAPQDWLCPQCIPRLLSPRSFCPPTLGPPSNATTASALLHRFRNKPYVQAAWNQCRNPTLWLYAIPRWPHLQKLRRERRLKGVLRCADRQCRGTTQDTWGHRGAWSAGQNAPGRARGAVAPRRASAAHRSLPRPAPEAEPGSPAPRSGLRLRRRAAPRRGRAATAALAAALQPSTRPRTLHASPRAIQRTGTASEAASLAHRAGPARRECRLRTAASRQFVPAPTALAALPRLRRALLPAEPEPRLRPRQKHPWEQQEAVV
mmetsp:Transcript_46531/g.83920  ORF Transcript_46531/g.83920 Transcript_46531/m.83920 type:complete len:271 (-) Transcript_46531:1978-2790(-)